MKSYAGIAAICMLSMSSVACVPFPGQRLITVQVEADGQLIFEGQRGVPDSTPVVEMWDVLDDVEFKSTSIDDADSSRPDAYGGSVHGGDLKGAVIVRIKHVEKELARVTLDGLTLQSQDSNMSWSLDEDEVRRIKDALSE